MLRPVFYEKHWKKRNLIGTVNILTVMGGELYKGLETVAQIASVLLKNTSVDFRWHVVGISDEQPVPRIVKRWLKIQYSTLNIELVGNKNESEISDLLANADIYCQCSHIENSPNSLCEAMIIGMPIVAGFAGGTDSMLENYKEGILVQTGDYYSFAGAIKSLVDNPEIAYDYANKARERAISRHNPNSIIKELMDVYKTINENGK
jgi:glycosyltransferase involved in cell wall biosynthesis